MSDGLSRSLNVRGDDRPPHRHGLEERERQSLEVRGECEDVERRQQSHRVPAVTGEDHASRQMGSGEALDLGPQCSVPDDDEPEVVDLSARQRARPDQDVVSLLRIDPTHGPYDETVGIQPQPRASPACLERPEPIRGEARVDHVGPPARHPAAGQEEVPIALREDDPRIHRSRGQPLEDSPLP